MLQISTTCSIWWLYFICCKQAWSRDEITFDEYYYCLLLSQKPLMFFEFWLDSVLQRTFFMGWQFALIEDKKDSCHIEVTPKQICFIILHFYLWSVFASVHWSVLWSVVWINFSPASWQNIIYTWIFCEKHLEKQNSFFFFGLFPS